MVGAIFFSVLFLVFGEISSTGEYLPSEVKDLLTTLHDICVKKLGLPDDISKNYDISNNSPEIMCYMKCLMVEGKWAENDETILYQAIIDDTNPKVKDIILNMLDSCRDIPPGSQDCEKTYNFFACLHNADSEHFYLP